MPGTDRLQRLDFSWRPEEELDAEAAAAAVQAELAARQKRQQLQRLTKQANESQQVCRCGCWGWVRFCCIVVWQRGGQCVLRGGVIQDLIVMARHIMCGHSER